MTQWSPELEAYNQGWDDYLDGYTYWDSPYEDGGLADAWAQGWEDAESAQGRSTE